MHLVVTVRFAEGRFHGRDDWPPSPARLFQALIAGAGLSGPLADSDKDAFRWLETLKPPVIAAPEAKEGHDVTFFVPRNDLDAVQGDLNRIDKIRYPKTMRPRHFDVGIPLVYAWSLADKDRILADRISAQAANVYRLGHGVDTAWATGEIIDERELEASLSVHGGRIFKPSGNGEGIRLKTPRGGSFDSLESRYQAQRTQIETKRHGRAFVTSVALAGRPLFALASYNAPPARRVFRLTNDGDGFAAWPLRQVATFVLSLNVQASGKLSDAAPATRANIESAFGRPVVHGDGSEPDSARVRIIPLPSIGHRYADAAIRRVLVEVPSTCPVRAQDIFWGFSGLRMEGATGAAMLTPLQDDDEDTRMLDHYGVSSSSHVWRTVTPMVLTARRRIEPVRRREEAKGGEERAEELRIASEAVLRALVETRIGAPVETVRIQQEPFVVGGERSEAFVEGSGFPKERLWHVEITFVRPVEGPLVLGRGRFRGLGIMAPGPERGSPMKPGRNGGGKPGAPI